MGATGHAVVDFGVLPGSDSTSLAITGQAAIGSGSFVEAWLDATVAATTAHSVDEHIMAAADLGITCSDIVPGTGFTIHIVSRSGSSYGQWNVAWVWV